MMKKKCTHRGKIVCAELDNREHIVFLRETKMLWISRWGTRYRKSDGRIPGRRFPGFVLDLDSVTKR